MHDTNKSSRIMIVYATWNGDKREGTKIYATDQLNFYRFNNDGFRLCMTIPKNLS